MQKPASQKRDVGHPAVTLSHDRREPHSAFQRTAISGRPVKVAIAGETIFHKMTIRELALDEKAVGKAGPAEDAIGELTFYERADIEKSPVPIDVFEGAVVEIRVNRTTLWRQAFKGAEFEVLVMKIDRGKVIGVYCLCEHRFSLCMKSVSCTAFTLVPGAEAPIRVGLECPG